MEYGFLSLAIPLLAIVLSIVTKDVVISLMGGIFVGELVLHDWQPTTAFVALFDGIVGLFSESWITKTVIFILLIGSIINILNKSGAVEQFVNWLSQKSSSIDSPRGAMLLAYVIGVIIFIESSITSLVAGTVAKPLCDKNGVSREKLAYICDSTSAPICSLIPLNAWGALLLGLIVASIDSGVISGNAISLLIASIPYNFYSIATLLIVLVVIFKNFHIGPMAHAQAVAYVNNPNSLTGKSSPFPMLLSVVFMVAMVPFVLYLTGEGDIFKGSGSTSIFYAVIATVILLYIYFVATKLLSHKEYFASLYSGMGEMIPLAIIIILALLIGDVVKELQTAQYLTHIMQGNFPPFVVPLLIFVVSSLIAFSTGTSWGTFSIMMPIALSIAATLHLDVPLVIGAVISGGIFGDHASPISDTTIIASLAAECDHIEHVRTQLPYALLGSVIASIAFLVAGFVLA